MACPPVFLGLDNTILQDGQAISSFPELKMQCLVTHILSTFADFTNRRVQVARTPFQSPGNLNFGQNSGRFGVPKGPNVKSAKLLLVYCEG